MPQLFFLIYIFLLGFSFGIFLKKWIPLNFLVFSSFLWGSILFASILIIINIIGIKLSHQILLILIIISLSIPIIYGLRTRLFLTSKEWSVFAITSISFSLLNFLFITFNYTLATEDSFSILRIGRSISYWGFDQNAVERVLVRGVFIPILQSVSVFINSDYLVSLQFSFAFSFILVFFYLSECILKSLFVNKSIVTPLVITSTVLLVSTPLFIIQFFYIHATLTSGIFLFTAIVSFWLSITEKNNYWLVFFLLSSIGVIFSRAETFIYMDFLLILILVTNKFSYESRLKFLIPVIMIQIAWFLYMLFRIETFSSYVNPQRFILIIFGLIMIIGIIIFSNKFFLAKILLTLKLEYVLIPVSFVVIVLILLRPEHMLVSIGSFLSNTFVTGYWGFSFWIIFPLVIISLFKKSHTFVTFLSTFILSTIGIILVMVIIRPPYHLYWTDSSNRLMTIILPVGLLMVSIIIGKWVDSPVQSQNNNTFQ